MRFTAPALQMNRHSPEQQVEQRERNLVRCAKESRAGRGAYHAAFAADRAADRRSGPRGPDDHRGRAHLAARFGAYRLPVGIGGRQGAPCPAGQARPAAARALGHSRGRRAPGERLAAGDDHVLRPAGRRFADAEHHARGTGHLDGGQGRHDGVHPGYRVQAGFDRHRAHPVRTSGVRTAAGGLLGAPVTVRFRTKSYSTLRLQELLAQLGYLPLTWTPSGSNPAADDRAAQLSAAYRAPAGRFTWQGNYPGALTSMWAKGTANLIDVGAIRAFQSVEGLTMDGVAGTAVWRDLLRAVAKGQDNPNGYSYGLASKGSPETLTVWHNGHVVAAHARPTPGSRWHRPPTAPTRCTCGCPSRS